MTKRREFLTSEIRILIITVDLFIALACGVAVIQGLLPRLVQIIAIVNQLVWLGVIIMTKPRRDMKNELYDFNS